MEGFLREVEVGLARGSCNVFCICVGFAIFVFVFVFAIFVFVFAYVFVFATFVFVFAIFVFVFSTKVGLARYPEDPGSAAKILLHRLPLVIKNILFQWRTV